MTRGPRRIFVFRYRLTTSGFAGPKSFGDFRETGPAMTKQMTVSYRALAQSSNTINYTDGEKNNNIDTKFLFFLII